MAEKHLVVEGATCQCKFSVEPKKDTLKVKSHAKHYVNDQDAADKLIATDKEIGQTLEKNTFGKCKMQPNGTGDYLPCQAIITKWSGFYEKTTLSHEGKVLLEDSKGTCPIGGPDCITITDHGQTSAVTKKNVANSKPEIVSQIFPGVDFEDVDNAVLMIQDKG